MKKKLEKGILLFLLCTLVICTGCGSSSKGVGATLSANSHKLTKEQRLADYDAMWKDIEENYPLMGVAERTVGINAEEVKKRYRSYAEIAPDDRAFFGAIQCCGDAFGECGHMQVFDAENYNNYLQLYQEMPCSHWEYLYNLLNNQASRIFYGYIEEKVSSQTEQTGNGKDLDDSNLSTEILKSGRIAYMKIKSMVNLETDIPKIQSFFKKIKSYQNCIIDIRGNGGGDSRYWIDAIVAPNLDKPVSYTNYELVQGETARSYLKTTEKIYPISQLPELPNLNQNDLRKMKYFTKCDTVIKNVNKKKKFTGKFYLLTDGDVYSSAEGFTIFCKQTGFATIIGEPTEGDGIGIDPLIFVLPNSGICLRFSSTLGLNPDGGSNEEFGTVPDVLCKDGEDALSACLDLINSKN